jgi:hypothetical protein
MKMARYAILPVILSAIISSSAIAQEAEKTKNPLEGKTLWQLVDTLYGDFAKCWAVPKVAVDTEAESPFLLPMPSILRKAFQSDKASMAELPPNKQTLVRPAFGIAYFLFALLITIALSSVFLWIGAGLAGQRKEGGNFMKALICSSFDRISIATLLIAVTFGLGRALNPEGLAGVMGTTIIPGILVFVFFLISTWIVKLVYHIHWGKAFLIQVCTRVAVILVAVFILGFASAVSLASAT